MSKGTHQVYGPSQVLGTNSCTFLCMPWLVATIHREGSEEVPPPYPQGECPMTTMPPDSAPTAPEVPTQDPRPGALDTPKIHPGARRRVWVAVLFLIAMTMGTFLMMKSGKFFDRVFPPPTPEEFNRSGVSAAVLREWKNARADHEAIALTVAQCLDLGDAYGHAGFLNKQLMLDLEPTDDRLRYAGAKEDLTAKPLKLTSFQRGAIYLSDTITRERIERAGVISHHYRVMNGLNMAIIIIGAITTTLISVKATASGDQVKNLLYQIIGITAIFLSAFGTIASGLNSFYNPRCSSANTLRIQRLKFGREKLTKGPDVIRHACRQRWCALPPARTNRTMVCALMQWQRLSQAHVRSGHVVKGLEEDHSLPQALAVFTEAGCLTGQRCHSLTQRQVHPFDQGCADRMAQGRQAFGSKHDAGAERPQFALLLLCDQLPVDQIRMGRTAGLAWASPLAGACKRGHDVASSDQGRQRAREAVADERRNARDTCRRDGHDFLGSVERTRSHNGCDHPPKLGGKADPDPLPPLLAVWPAFPSCVCLTRVLARDAVPHLVELSLGHRQRPPQRLVDRFGLVRRASQPRQHGLFGDPEHTADPRQITPDQEHLEGHHDFFFRGTEVEKDGLACLRKGRRACVATQDASLAALGEGRCESTDVAKLHASIMNARGIGARLAPIFGLPHRSILRGV